MSISVETTRNDYAGSGSTGPFAFNFMIYDDADLLVIKTDSNDVETVLVLDTDYTVAGTGETTGGTVTLTDTLDSGYTLSILRAMDYLQSQEYTSGRQITTTSLNDALDKLEMQIQQVKEKADRSFQSPQGMTHTDWYLPPQANTLIGFDSSGTELKCYDSMSIVDIPLIDYIGNYGDSLATAVSTIGVSRTNLYIGYAVTVPADCTVPENICLWIVEGGRLNVASGKTLTINRLRSETNAQIFGGLGSVVLGPSVEEAWCNWWCDDGVGSLADPWTSPDDTAGILAAVNSGCKRIRLHAGYYSVSDTIIILDAVTIEGAGFDDTTILSTVAGNTFQVGYIDGSSDAARDITISNLGIEVSGTAGVGIYCHTAREFRGKDLRILQSEDSTIGIHFKGGRVEGATYAGVFYSSLERVFFTSDPSYTGTIQLQLSGTTGTGTSGRCNANNFHDLRFYGGRTNLQIGPSYGNKFYGVVIEDTASNDTNARMIDILDGALDNTIYGLYTEAEPDFTGLVYSSADSETCTRNIVFDWFNGAEVSVDQLVLYRSNYVTSGGVTYVATANGNALGIRVPSEDATRAKYGASAVSMGDGISDAWPVLYAGGATGPENIISYAATVTPDLTYGNSIRVSNIAGSLTIATPTGAVGYPVITFNLLSDSTGGRVVTFDAGYTTGDEFPYTLDANERILVQFAMYGTHWYQTSSSYSRASADIPAHNSLASIQGGSTNERYHLTAAQAALVGPSSYTDGGLLIGNGSGAIQATAAGATTEILVGGGTGTDPVWTTATGTGAPVRSGSPTFTSQITAPIVYGSAASNGDLQLDGTSDSTKTTSNVDLQKNGGNVTIGGASTGTSANKVLSIAEGTAPTTSPADAAQVWVANQNGAGTDTMYYRNEAGQSGVVAHQAPLVNLLSNSGFGVWSNGSLENVGSNYNTNLFSTWAGGNTNWETFNFTGSTINSAIESTGGNGYVNSEGFTTTSGKTYKISINMSLTGASPILDGYGGFAGLSATLVNGLNTIYCTSTTTSATLRITANGACNFSATCALYYNGTNLVASWTNADYDTFTSTGGNITSAVYSTSGTQDASTAAITIVSGKLYRIIATLTLNSGAAPTLAMTNLGHTTAALSAGANTFVYEATSTSTTLTMSNTAASNYACTFSIYEVTPACIGSDTLGPDGHSKTSTLLVYQFGNDATYISSRFYGVKLTKGADTAEYYNFNTIANEALLARYKGRTVSFGCHVYSVTATDNIKVQIYDGVGTTESSFVGAGALTWVEITHAVSASATQFTPRILCDGSTGNVAYVSAPMLIFGPSIGAGNYVSRPSEIIHCEKVISLTGYTATTSAADATINLESASSGMIPKGAKAVLVKAYCKDSAAGDGVGMDLQTSSGVENGLSLDTQVNNVRVQGQGWVACDANGDIYFDHRGSGASALTVDVKVIGVQVS